MGLKISLLRFTSRQSLINAQGKKIAEKAIDEREKINEIIRFYAFLNVIFY